MHCYNWRRSLKLVAVIAVALTAASARLNSRETPSHRECGDCAATLLCRRPDFGAVKGSRAIAPFGNLPLEFEPNVGQADPRVTFLSHANGYTLLLTANEAVLVGSAAGEPASTGSEALRIVMVDASPSAKVVGRDEERIDGPLCPGSHG